MSIIQRAYAGASPCAGGIPGACDELFLPSYTLPVAIVFVILLFTLLLLRKKGIFNIRLHLLIGVWVIAVLIFTGLVLLQTESEGDRVKRSAEKCRIQDQKNGELYDKGLISSYIPCEY